MSTNEDFTQVEATVKVLTKKAALLIIEDVEHWVPFSQIFEDDLIELEPGLIMEISITTWFYDKEIA